MSLNSETFFLIYNLNGHNYFIDRLMVFGANELIFLTFFLIFLLIIFGGAKEKKAFLFIIAGVIFAELLIKITHIFFFESRPFITFNFTPLISHVPDAAFPSEHTAITATLAFAYLFCKSKFSKLFLLFMLWVGFARIYVGVHYPLDILGGIITGFVAVYTIVLLNKKIKLF